MQRTHHSSAALVCNPYNHTPMTERHDNTAHSAEPPAAAAPASSTSSHGHDVPDASTKEVLLYALGNIDNGIASQFFAILQSLMVVAMRINPMILGLILGIKTFWDAVTDPVMAQITDNFKSRWGRRRPFILIGGVSRSALLAVLILWFPKVQNMSSNRVLEGDKQSTELLALAQRSMHSLTNYLTLLAHPGARLDERHLKDIQAIHAGYYHLTNMYGILIPDILDDYSQRQARLAHTEHALSNALASGDARLIATKSANREYAQTIVKNAKSMIDRLDKAMAVSAANCALLALLDDVRHGRRPAAEALAQVASILAPLGGDGVPAEVRAAAEQARAASQSLIVASTLAARARTATLSEQHWQSALTAMIVSAEAETVMARNSQRIQEMLAAAQAAANALELRAGTNDVLAAGVQRGLLLYARERLAALTDLQAITARCAANREAAAVLQRCHAGTLDVASARSHVEERLAGFTGAARLPAPRKSTIRELGTAWRIFWDPDNRSTRSVTIYILIGLLLFTTFTTIQSVPYYALGIELCPSYDGRTRVVTYRSIVDHIAGIIGPYVAVFCYMLWFHNALDGLFYIAILACGIGIPATTLMVLFIKERMAVAISKRQFEHHQGIIMSFVSLCKNPNFLRIIFLYNFLGIVQAMFLPLGSYLNIYWVMGSAGAGARIGAFVGTFAWVLGLINLPVLKWACQKFQKHVVMRCAIILMSVGMTLNYFCMVKGHPEYQFITPIFFSIGIASYYMVLSTMMADVTDHDELITGFRREGMFGAVNAFIIKIVGTISAVLPGVILVLSGFDPVLEYNQTPQTIMNMRIMNSFVPGLLTLGCLLVLYKYPLTRARVEEIKDVLRQRRADRAAMEAAALAAK